jgi:ribosomal protein S13
MQNTNVNGRHKASFALRIIKGLGRRFSNLTLKIAQVDMSKRAGELTETDIEKISDIIQKPLGKLIAFVNRAFRIRSAQVVPQQTEMHQGWFLQSAHFQHG